MSKQNINKIIVYTSKTCAYCDAVKKEFNKNNIVFEEKLITEHEKDWKSINNLTEIPSTPTIFFKEECFVPGRDFYNAEHLINKIKEFELSKFSYEKRIYEKLKSLNYNLVVAFSRTDKILKEIENKINK